MGGLNSLFGSQVNRLQRDEWASTKQLAEELWAMLGSVQPIRMTGPLELIFSGTDGESPIRVLFDPPPGLGDLPTPEPIQINRTPLPETIFNLGQPGEQGGPDEDERERIIESGGGGTQLFFGVTLGPGGGSSALPAALSGAITSGTQKQYSVLLDNGSTVNVTQMQIAADADVPDGSAVLVKRVTGGYIMQHPVWRRE